MKRVVAALVLLAAVAGCATGSKKVSLNSFVGKPLDVVKATYGPADFFARDEHARRSYSFRLTSS